MDNIRGKKEDIESPANIAPNVDEGDLKPAVTEDAVFGVIEGDGPNYRNVYLYRVAFLFSNETDNS